MQAGLGGPGQAGCGPQERVRQANRRGRGAEAEPEESRGSARGCGEAARQARRREDQVGGAGDDARDGAHESHARLLARGGFHRAPSVTARGPEARRAGAVDELPRRGEVRPAPVHVDRERDADVESRGPPRR